MLREAPVAVAPAAGAPRSAPPRRVAIVGSGVAGLVAAHRLRHDCDLAIFEADDRIGGHVNTVPVELEGRVHAVDTGFIVFNPLNYPRFCRLLEELDVPSREGTMSFGVRCAETGIEYAGTSLATLFAQPANALRPAFLRMVRDIMRFADEAERAIAGEIDETTPLEDWLAERRFSTDFVERYLMPLGASIWSCPRGAFGRFPIGFVAAFLHNHRMLRVGGRPTWRTVAGGSARYVDRIVAPFRDRIRLRTPVRRIERDVHGVVIATDAGSERFDGVVLACHADQALRLLAAPTEAEREILGAFPFQPNEAILHLDASILPRARRARAGWNFLRRGAGDDAQTITYDMTVLQGLDAPRPILVTLNGSDLVDPDLVLARFRYDHPVFTAGRAAARHRHDELLGANRTWFCGAWWGWGFHEDGVASAERAAASLLGAPA